MILNKVMTKSRYFALANNASINNLPIEKHVYRPIWTTKTMLVSKNSKPKKMYRNLIIGKSR